MFCEVVLLRSNGWWISRAAAENGPRFKGWLEYRKAEKERWGPSMQARLLRWPDLKDDLLPPLQFAKVQIKFGGVLAEGKTYSFRATKSKGEERVQTWWCMVHLEQALAALARMRVPCSTGFHPDDDDEPGHLPFLYPR